MDSLALKGKTWDMDETGYVGKMKGKKALVLSTAGGVYDNTPFAPFEHAVSWAKGMFQFMGYSEVGSQNHRGIKTSSRLDLRNGPPG